MIYLNIGSNLPSYNGNRYQNINKAILLMSDFFDIKKRSDFYETPSYPNKSNPKFVNIMLKGKTILEPIALLERLKKIEKKIGRIKKIKMSLEYVISILLTSTEFFLKRKIYNYHTQDFMKEILFYFRLKRFHLCGNILF